MGLILVCLDCRKPYDVLSEEEPTSTFVRCAECQAILEERARLESTPVSEPEAVERGNAAAKGRSPEERAEIRRAMWEGE